MRNLHTYMTTVLLMLLLHTSTAAQSELTLYQMPDVPKIMSINPALSPWANAFVGMPGISNINVSVGSDFATFAEFGLMFDPLRGQFDFDSDTNFEEVLLAKATDKNQFISSNSIDLLSFGGRIKKGFFSFAVTEHLDARLGFPRDLIQLFNDLGQEDPSGLIGEVYDLSNLSLIGSHYRTYNLSYSYDLSRDLTLGARVGFVQGLGNSFMERQNYQVMATANGFESMGELTARNAGLQFLYDDEQDVNATDYLLSSGNSGLVFGFGGQYRLSPKLDIAASVNNIGSIKWKTNVGTAVLTETFTEEQEDLGVYSENLFDVDTEAAPAYTTFLPAAFSVQANYYVLPFFSVSGLVYSRGANGVRSTSASLAGNVKLLKVLNLTAAVHHVQKKVGLGLGGSLNLGPLQLYLASDNAINLLTGSDANRAQLTGGVFFTFNKLSHKENMARLDALYPTATDSTALLATHPTSEPKEEVEATGKERSFFAFGKKNKNETPDEDASEDSNLAASAKKDKDESLAETAVEVSTQIPETILAETPAATELLDTQADDLPDITPIKERTTPAPDSIQTAPVPSPSPRITPIPGDRDVFLELKQDANMYQSATTSSTMIRRMFSGTKVKLREQVSTDWWKVSWGSKTGYMRSEVLQLSGSQYQSIITQMDTQGESVQSAPQAEIPGAENVLNQTTTPQQTQGSFFVTQRTSFRKAATHKSDVIVRFRVGDKVDLLEKTNQWWWKVRFDGNTGWVKAALLEQF